MRRILLALSFISLFGGSACATAKFEPPAGRILLIGGQNLEDIQATIEASHQIPGGVMSYTSLAQAEGTETAYKAGDGTQHAQKLVELYPQSALQIGLWMVGDCGRIASGDLDSAIDRLGEWIRKTNRPVYLRVGYEFDGPHNHYPPKDYVKAYQRLVDRFRKNGITNVAFVWHSYGSVASKDISPWYPGDSYVDWVGLSYFNQPQGYMKPVVEFAKLHQKPLMIGEASPWVMQTKYANSWNLWFKPLFKFARENNVKAISYISCDWNSMAQFAGQKWGDTRLQTSPEILKQWLSETSQATYLKASPELFKTLGFDPSKK